MATDKNPAYQWYPKDHVTDERVLLMDLEQEGALRRLLDHQWLHETIPFDEEELAAILRCDRERFDRIWKRVRHCFEPSHADESRLINPRLDRQRRDLIEFSERQRENGRRGGRPRIEPNSGREKPKQNPEKTETKPKTKPGRKPRVSSGESQSKAKKSSPDSRLQTPKITEASASDGKPSVPANAVWAEVEAVLSGVCERKGWDPPLAKDIRRYLRAESALRQLVSLFGVDEAVQMFVFALDNWRGSVSWEAVFDKRNRLREQMVSPNGTGEPAVRVLSADEWES